MVLYGMVWVFCGIVCCGIVLYGDMVWYAILCYAMVLCGMVWYGYAVVWYSVDKCSVVWYGIGMLWCGTLWISVVWYVMVWYWYAVVWYAVAKYGGYRLVWCDICFGMVLCEMVWHCSCCRRYGWSCSCYCCSCHCCRCHCRLFSVLRRVFTFSDGVVTKEEMKNYFLKANFRALGRDFCHNFQETTYLTPSFCEHCGGMVSTLAWGADYF